MLRLPIAAGRISFAIRPGFSSELLDKVPGAADTFAGPRGWG